MWRFFKVFEIPMSNIIHYGIIMDIEHLQISTQQVHMHPPKEGVNIFPVDL